MAKKDGVTGMEGTVVKALLNAILHVGLKNGRVVFGHTVGKMRQYYIRILPEDRAVVELNPYDLPRGRIAYRYKWPDTNYPTDSGDNNHEGQAEC